MTTLLVDESLQTEVASALSPEVEWYLETRSYVLPEQTRPLWRTPEPRDVPGGYFDPERVDNAIKALSALRHTQGQWAGQPMIPDAWQVAYLIAPVFGWVYSNSQGKIVRIIQSAWLEVPRKNGKTTIAAAIALILAFADGEFGAQVYAAAASKGQALFAYTPAKQIAESTPSFRRAGIKAMQKGIVRSRDGSYMKAVAAIGDLLQGTNPSCYIVDELHVHKSADVIDALESGVGARAQPLGLIISTADDGTPYTVYDLRRKEIEELCSGTLKNPAKYGVIFAARDSDDPFSEVTHAAANPGYPISPSPEAMRAAATAAKASPQALAKFQRYNLNIRVNQAQKYIPLPLWDRNAGEVNEEDLEGMLCYAGLDLASVSDLSAVALLFPMGDGTYAVLFRFWTPEENVAALDKRTSGSASLWVKQGWLTVTPGNVTDYDFIEAQLVKDSETFDIQGFGYDPFGATQLVGTLQDDYGLPMVKVRQGFLTLSQPTKEILRTLMKGNAEDPHLRHSGNPVMRWMTDNLNVETDPAGNVKPSKKGSGGHNMAKIDGWSALVTAMSECMNDGGTSGNSQDGEITIA